ncbi:MAG: hypothetical protein M1817_000963 [Caeruleum heppii]|nr:MAG: hypothetical protein M1817_000963 [Caeruleum heppii]
MPPPLLPSSSITPLRCLRLFSTQYPLSSSNPPIRFSKPPSSARSTPARSSPQSSPQSRSQKSPGRLQALSDQILEHGTAQDLEKLWSRRWKVGDVYAPHDLSSVEMSKFKKRSTTPVDAFDQLGIDPRDEYKNFSIMSEYMTSMGRIKHSSQTGLRPINQRRMAKALRRAIGVGLMPSVHAHPEILELELLKRRTSGRYI